MKKIIFLLCIFVHFNLYANDSESIKIDNEPLKINIYYSPFSFINFGGHLSNANKGYGFIEQFSEIPIKSIGYEVFSAKGYNFIKKNKLSESCFLFKPAEYFLFGLNLNFTHNRITNKKIFSPEYNDEKNISASITSLSFGFIILTPMPIASNHFFNKLSFGLSDVTVWKSPVLKKDFNWGLYMSYGFRYYFSEISKNKLNINTGIDLTYTGGYSQHPDGKYLDFKKLGIYPYVGFMW